MTFALHGNLGLPEDMHPLLRAAGASPGTAASPHLWRALADHPQTASLPGFAAHLNEIAAPCVVRPRVLIGYSLGARLALHALTRAPEIWHAAILISAHPGLGTEEERAARLSQDREWGARVRSEPWPDLLASWNRQPVFHGDHRPDDSAAELDYSTQLEPWRRQIALGFSAWSLGQQADLRPLLPRVSCPVLWLTGGKDAKFTALAAECCALLPDAQHVIIRDAGHRAHQHAAGPGLVAEFLARKTALSR
jgi:2-succinyl-6-hydroxy-2,4-cyclohexadiene-1-carboxylate synthase